MSESKELGQRAYEAWRGPRADVFGPWSSLLASEKAAWVRAESASTPEPAAADRAAITMEELAILHLASITQCLEEETSEGDGISERHWKAYKAAKDFLHAASTDRHPDRPAEVAAPPRCRACGEELTPECAWVADGCPCNSPRGVNHGLVPRRTCTCVACDPEQTGSTRVP